jgi:hypothetical protein
MGRYQSAILRRLDRKAVPVSSRQQFLALERRSAAIRGADLSNFEGCPSFQETATGASQVLSASTFSRSFGIVNPYMGSPLSRPMHHCIHKVPTALTSRFSGATGDQLLSPG